MNDHIAKPIDPGKLALTLARWLEGRAQTPRRPPAAVEKRPAPAPALPGVDLDFALRNLGGNVELFEQLIDLFVEEHSEAAEALARPVAEGAWKRVNALAHGLKGAASTLGALGVAEIARVIEQAAREAAPDAAAIAQQVDALGHAVAEIVEGVAARRREATAAAAGAPSQQAPPAAAEILPLLDELKRLFEAGDADAETQSERLAGRLAQTAAAMRAAEIARSAGRYDFDAAAATLAELRSQVADWA